MASYTGEDVQYSLHDIVTIASMIEKETDGTNNDERNDYRSIASVIYNRLENPRRARRRCGCTRAAWSRG